MFDMTVGAGGTENTGDTERLEYPWSTVLDALAILSNVLKGTKTVWVGSFTPSHPLKR